MTTTYFPGIEPVAFRTSSTSRGLAFRHYDPDRLILGKRMEDHLRVAVCYWHSFCWPGSDVFGEGTFPRPWLLEREPMEGARRKADAAFEFLGKLGVRYFTFHDRDIAPEGASLAEGQANLERMVDYIGEAMARTGKRLLWGTANLFGHPRYAAGAATSPDPALFACAAFQVKNALEATHRLGGDGYVLWGGREGYDTLLNTDLGREVEQLGRFMTLVVEHKHRIGFAGDLFIEPKPMEPSKHQYDFDTAAVFAFLQKFGLQREIKVNIEVNHATLSGHTFHHEVAYALANGIFGTIDANRGDPQLGWDTDQFPNSVEELTPVLHALVDAGGFSRGGFNFDAKLRRQSTAREDLFHAHIGGIDTLALALEKGAGLVQEGILKRIVAERYSAWNGELGRAILDGSVSLAQIAARAPTQGPDPRPRSGEQERIEGLLQRHLYG